MSCRSSRWRWLAPDDLLRQADFRRLWLSLGFATFGSKITFLALPLCAALQLQATPSQMGLLGAMQFLPFTLFSLPAGVWLDRVSKLKVYIAGELLMALAVASVALAWALGQLSMGWLYGVAFVIGSVHTVAYSASQVVLTLVVPRDRLLEGHARNTLVESIAEVAGPTAAGLLIRWIGAPLTLLVDALLLVGSVSQLRGLGLVEPVPASPRQPLTIDLAQGLRFVFKARVLLALTLCIALWQIGNCAAAVTQILIAHRTLGLSEAAIGLCFALMGCSMLAFSLVVGRVSRRIGPGPCVVLGFSASALGWMLPYLFSEGIAGVAAFVLMLVCYSMAYTFVFTNFLAVRQSMTPPALQGRMTANTRCLSMVLSAPGALLGGWIGQQFGLGTAMLFAGVTSASVALVAALLPSVWRLRQLPLPAPAASR